MSGGRRRAGFGPGAAPTGPGGDPEDLLRGGAAELAPGLPPERIELLVAYYRELSLWNRSINLVADEGAGLVVRHILDSLAALPFVAAAPKGGIIADFGSGAGLPGIPLAIALPERRFVLVESQGKRCGFLRNVIAVLRLPNVELRQTRFEDLDENFDLIVFRAFLTFDAGLWASLERRLKPLGSVMAYKGRRDKTESEAAMIDRSRYDVRIEPLRVPGLDEERQLLIARSL